MLMKSRHNRDVDEINRDYIVRRFDKIFTKVNYTCKYTDELNLKKHNYFRVI